MGRIILICFFIIALTSASNAGIDTTLHLQREKAITGNYTNIFDNIFLISQNNQIKKLNQNLDSVGVFNDVRHYGNIYSLDVNNPLKIVVYYKDFTTVLVLDRFLN